MMTLLKILLIVLVLFALTVFVGAFVVMGILAYVSAMGMKTEDDE